MRGIEAEGSVLNVALPRDTNLHIVVNPPAVGQPVNDMRVIGLVCCMRGVTEAQMMPNARSP